MIWILVLLGVAAAYFFTCLADEEGRAYIGGLALLLALLALI